MRVITDVEELAIILHATHMDPEDHKGIFGTERLTWDQEADFNKDDYRAQAERLLARLRIATKPGAVNETHG